MLIANNCYRAILRLRAESARLEKLDILESMRTSPTFRKVLFQTYSPYVRYHIRKIPKTCRGKGSKDLDADTWALLNQLSLRTLTGTVARETLFEHMESLCPSAAEVLRLVVQKDLKCGTAVATINKVFPNLIPTFECQLVDDWDDSRARYPMLVGPKVDCVRGEFRGGQFFTRRGHKITGLDHIVQYIESVGKHIELSGELYIPGMSFHRGSGIIRSNKAQKLNVRFAVFDITSIGSMPYDQRHKYLGKTFFPLGTKPAPAVMYIPHVMVDNKAEAVALFKRWVAQGWEGLVGKFPTGFVKAGKGSYDWMRMVYGCSAEYQVVNFYESEEMPGQLGGAVLEGNIRVGSGFTEDERIKYLADPSLILGKYATIMAKEKTKTGSLRQPIWKGIRHDL